MIYVILGPTASGKSFDAHELAKAINGEIINGDAFQIYKQLNIGVAKPEKELLDIPHHLFSFVDVDKPYSIMEYQIDCRKKIEEISNRGKNIVIVGGSGLYIRSALYDYQFNKQENKIDMSKYEKMDNDELFKILHEIDPKEATIIHKNNRKRVLRAIEIYLINGEAKSSINAKQEHKAIYDVTFLFKDISRDVLYERINQRVDKMINDGLIDEVKSLLTIYDSNLQSLQAIGYKEIIGYLSNLYSLEEAIELLKKNTRNYAKRQLTFIKHQFNAIPYQNIEQIINKINN